MKRWLFDSLTLLSLTLFVCTAIMWIRSYLLVDIIGNQVSSSLWSVGTNSGVIAYYSSHLLNNDVYTEPEGFVHNVYWPPDFSEPPAPRLIARANGKDFGWKFGDFNIVYQNVSGSNDLLVEIPLW